MGKSTQPAETGGSSPAHPYRDLPEISQRAIVRSCVWAAGLAQQRVAIGRGDDPRACLERARAALVSALADCDQLLAELPSVRQ